MFSTIHEAFATIIDAWMVILQSGADPNRQGKITYNGADCWFLTPLQLVLRHIPEEGWPFDPELAEMLLLAGMGLSSILLLKRSSCDHFFRDFPAAALA